MWLSHQHLPTRIWIPDADPKLPQFSGPSVVANLGNRAQRYASALCYLAGLGWEEAPLANDVLSTEAERLHVAYRVDGVDVLESGRLAPVTLHHAARWRLDAPGIISLQLLLHLWLAKRCPGFTSTEKDAVLQLDDFSIRSRNNWWALALDLFKWAEKRPYGADVPYLWIPSSSKRRGWEVTRKLRDRFLAFAPGGPL